MKDKAQMHIEVMISFIIFIGFVVFALFFIYPLRTKEDPVKNMEYIRRNIIDNLSIETTKIGVVVNNPSDPCYNLGEYINANHGNAYQKKITNELYEIYLNENLTESIPYQKYGCSSNDYVVGAITKEEIVSYERIFYLKKLYETNYAKLKKELGIAEDFTFSFREICDYDKGSVVSLFPRDYQAYYPLDISTEANDSTGHYNGTKSYGFLFEKNELRQTAYFDGSDDYINVGDKYFEIGKQFSICFWFKLNRSESERKYIVDKGNNQPFSISTNIFDGSDNIIATISNSKGDVESQLNIPHIAKQQWYHLAFTYNQTANSEKLKLYLNSTKKASSESGITNINSHKMFIIGADSPSGNSDPTSGYFNGWIDEMMIFNRTLSDKEIWAIFTKQNKEGLGICGEFNDVWKALNVTRQVPYGVDVETIEYGVRAINSSGDIHNFIMNIKVW